MLLERLRAWWRVGHAQGKMLPGGWLFPGLNPMDSLSTRQLNRAVHLAADAAHIDKRVSTRVRAGQMSDKPKREATSKTAIMADRNAEST